ncbi:MAG: hypothetical protein IT448_12750 [Phycisphaerales bacterium]|nr:hypothetical protein [Phycisphaerales bacterium]
MDLATPSSNTRLLDEAVARNFGLVLSYPSAGMWRHHKSRFLGDCKEGVWVESPPQEASLADALITSKEKAGCSFRNGQNKVVFTAPILKRSSEYYVNPSTPVEAVLIRWPETIKAVQRRLTYRVVIPKDFDLNLRIWRIGRDAHIKDRPLSSCELPCRLLDLSTGGLGVFLENRDGQSPAVLPADRLRVEMKHGEQLLIMEARLRYPPEKSKDNSCRAGIQLVLMQETLEGRRLMVALTRIVGQLQRQELRRFRMGLS